MALDQTIENIEGNLKTAYKQAVPGTILCVDQLMKERQTNPQLRSQWFYTADGEVYALEGKKETPTLRITREETNPVLKNIEDAFKQLVNEENYQVSPTDFAAVKAAADTVAVDLTKLKLQGNEDEYRCLVINTSKALGKYKEEEQRLLTRVFGPTEHDYVDNMKILRDFDQGIKETRIFVLNPDYVKEKARKGPIGRASWLNYFLNDSNFYAYVRYVVNGSRLRGVRRVAEGAALKKVVPQEIKMPDMEQILQYATPFVPDVAREQFEAGLRKLYKL